MAQTKKTPKQYKARINPQTILDHHIAALNRSIEA